VTDLFNVVQFFEDGSSEYARRCVTAEEAMTVLGQRSRSPAAYLGVIKRLIVTDDGDCCNAEWKYGEGFTYPPELVAAQKARALAHKGAL
jgi:hypothetical protein